MTQVKHKLSRLHPPLTLVILEKLWEAKQSKNGAMTDKELHRPVKNWSGNIIGDEVN